MDTSIAELRIGIARLARRMRFARDFGTVSESQLGTLFGLNFGGPQTIGRLAETERVRASSMNYTVGALVAKGLVSRTRGAEDARQVEIALTDAGRALVADVLQGRDAWLSDRVATLPADQQAQLIAVIPILKALADS